MNENSPPVQPAGSAEPLFRHLFSTAPARERQASARGFGGSVLLHGLLIALVIWAGSRSPSLLPTADMGAGTGINAGAPGGGGGGGENIALIQLTSPAPAPTPEPELLVPVPVPVPVPTPVPEPNPVPVPPVEVAASEVPDTAGTGASAGTGTGTRPGTGGPGVGPGSGGGTGGGEGSGVGSGTGPGTGKGRILAPYPEFLLIPPTAPGNVRGKTVVVRLAIDENGTVREVELMPATGNRGYDRELRRVAMGWKFKPARDPANNPIAVQFDVTFNF